jgi:hypothetical protein
LAAAPLAQVLAALAEVPTQAAQALAALAAALGLLALALLALVPLALVLLAPAMTPRRNNKHWPTWKRTLRRRKTPARTLV